MKLKKLLSLLIAGALASPSLFAEPFATQSLPDGRSFDYVPNQIIVKFKKGRGVSSSVAAQRLGAQSAHGLSEPNTQILTVPPGENMASMLSTLQNRDDIEFAEPNIIYRAFFTPTDPSYAGSQAYLQSAELNMEPAWDLQRGSTATIIGVVDTGTDLDHPDLVGNLWTDPDTGFYGRQFEIDFNGDGDCVDAGEQCASDVPEDNNFISLEYHGTHVAGLIAAGTNNGTNIASMCHGCQLMTLSALGTTGGGTAASVAEAIRWGADKGAHILNLSLGSSVASQTIQDAVDYALGKNVLLVAASGNITGGCSQVAFPASIDRVIAVGATTSSKTLASFSCTGKQLDVAAPGVDILSTTGGGGTGQLSGTSFSAPLVAGLAGLIKSIDPNILNDDITRFINFNADDIGTGGFDSSFGFGYINPLATLLAVQSASRNPDGSYLFATNNSNEGETFPAPNPYNPLSDGNVTFFLPSGFTANALKIQIFSVAGERVKTLSGTNRWDGRNDDGNTVASGLYFYRVESAEGDKTGKITVLK